MFSERASDVYATIEFKDPDDFYNREAPDPLHAWIIGGVLSLLTVVYWYLQRWRPVMESIREKKHTHLLNLRIVLSTIADNDDAIFTMLRVSCQSMLFLAGFQLNYLLTLIIMCVYYTIISGTDSLRVIISLNEADSLQDLVQVSKRDRRFLASTLTLMAKSTGKEGLEESKTNAAIDLKSQNVYEDISRSMIVVWLVFFTQFVLIAFVVVDAFGLETHTVIDKTNNVPIVGTLGSYLVYILGIFMQCVYLLGPKTNFGTSEQNPHFWLQLLLAAKKCGCQCKWTTADDGVQHLRVLRRGDWNLWLRFVMSFVINGVGFHVLVHALPIQVAGQSNLTGIVIRAVGMMYLVDLDDAPGTVLKLMEYNSQSETALAVTEAKQMPKPCPFGDGPATTVVSASRNNGNSSDTDTDNSQNKASLLMKRSPSQPGVINDITSSYSTSSMGGGPVKTMRSQDEEPSPDEDEMNGNDSKDDHDDDGNSGVADAPAATPATEPNVATVTAAITAEELIERAREQAQLLQLQLQRDLDALLLQSTSPSTKTKDDDKNDSADPVGYDKQANATATANFQTDTEPQQSVATTDPKVEDSSTGEMA